MRNHAGIFDYIERKFIAPFSDVVGWHAGARSGFDLDLGRILFGKQLVGHGDDPEATLHEIAHFTLCAPGRLLQRSWGLRETMSAAPKMHEVRVFALQNAWQIDAGARPLTEDFIGSVMDFVPGFLECRDGEGQAEAAVRAYRSAKLATPPGPKLMAMYAEKIATARLAIAALDEAPEAEPMPVGASSP